MAESDGEQRSFHFLSFPHFCTHGLFPWEGEGVEQKYEKSSSSGLSVYPTLSILTCTTSWETDEEKDSGRLACCESPLLGGSAAFGRQRKLKPGLCSLGGHSGVAKGSTDHIRPWGLRKATEQRWGGGNIISGFHSLSLITHTPSFPIFGD